jgi:serine/threonine-protein kinase RsbT
MDSTATAVSSPETVTIRASEDVVRVRMQVRTLATGLGFGIVDQTKIITAASELARNALDYGGGGEAQFEVLDRAGKKGLRVTFIDSGPGIPDVTQALVDGYSTGGGLGLGLSGAKRLSNEFEIQSAPGQGTRVVITRWK